MHTVFNAAVYGAFATIVSLFGGLLLGFVGGNLTFDLLSGHRFSDTSPTHIALAAIPAFGGFLAGSALWGVLMGRLAGAADLWRMAWSGMFGFAPSALAVGIGLQILEPIALEQLGAWLPLHRLFTLLFVPSAFLIAGVSACAIGIGLKTKSLAATLLWRVGLAAAVAFLVVNLVMDASGWVVGAPKAEERYTMLTVMSVSNLGAAIVGGAVLGATLHRAARSAPVAPILKASPKTQPQ